MKQITQKNTRPWRIVLYGKPGIGKTTFGASVPDPVMICAEDGAWGHDIERFEELESWTDFRDAVDQACASAHASIVIDTMDAAEKLAFSDFVSKPFDGKKYESIVETPFQKGFEKIVESHWVPVLKQLRSSGKNVLLLAHAGQQKQPSLEGEDYYLVYPALHKHLAARVIEWADAVLYAEPDIDVVRAKTQAKARAVSVGESVLWCRENGSRTAKNRFGMPEKLPWRRQPWELVRKWIEQPSEENVDKWLETVMSFARPETQERAKARLAECSNFEQKLGLLEKIKRA